MSIQLLFLIKRDFYPFKCFISRSNGFSVSKSDETSKLHDSFLSAGSQDTTSTKHQGSRVPYYSATTEVEKVREMEYVCKLQSVSAMPSYNDKSHEELRLEDYGLGDKGNMV